MKNSVFPSFAETPFNDLPPLCLKARKGYENLNPLLNEAHAAIQALNSKANTYPDTHYLVQQLTLLESTANSEIEGIHANLYKIFTFKDMERHRLPSEYNDVLNCWDAFSEGLKLIKTKPVITNTAVSICQVLKNTNLDVRKTTGTSIKDSNGQIVYTPPEGEGIIRSHLAQWEYYLNEALDIDPLIRMAEAHYQFEAIHPFIDGNGRTGRIINQVFLVDAGIMSHPVLCLSHAILQNLNLYYSSLRAVTSHGEWYQWTEFMLEMVIESCDYTINTIDKMIEITKKNDPEHQHIQTEKFLDLNY